MPREQTDTFTFYEIKKITSKETALAHRLFFLFFFFRYYRWKRTTYVPSTCWQGILAAFSTVNASLG